MTEKGKFIKSLGFVLLTFLLVGLLLFGTQSCGKQGPTIEDFSEKLKEKGFHVETTVDPYAGMLKAENGKRVFVNGERLEVYKFSSPNSKAAKNIAESGVNGQKAIKNGPLILFVKESHPSWGEIKKTFKSL